MLNRRQSEERAIARLIAEIDSIDRWRDRVGRRIICLFVATFVFALGLLIWTVNQAENHQPGALEHPGPRVPAVLKRLI